MGRIMLHHRKACAAIAALLLTSPATAQYIGGAPPPLPTAPIGIESPSDALARNVRILAQSPRNFAALVGAGKAAVATGDPEAAVGFFGRAAEVWPTAPAPKAGMGAALAAMGEGPDALAEFDKAQRAGAPVTSFAADRGLARDLLGQQALAQADYRLGLTGPDPAEARRRLALSLAISGDREGALTTLAPLLQRADPATNRVHAFVLALGGDPAAADRALDRSTPGMSSRLDPFFRRLANLSPAQKAAAVHLGIMPGNGAAVASAVTPFMPPPVSGPPVYGPTYAPITGPRVVPNFTRRLPPPPVTSYQIVTRPSAGDRLADIDALLRQPSQPASTAPPPQSAFALPTPAALAPATVATSTVAANMTAIAAAPTPRRYWVQLANGTDEAALGTQFAKFVAKDPELFTGIKPFVANVAGRSKLLVGPFKSTSDSATFVENLADAHLDGFSWTSPEGQVVRKIASP